MREPFLRDEVRRALAILVEPRAVFEIRALNAQFKGKDYRPTITISGYFKDPDACLSRLSELRRASGIYVTLNPVKPALLSRRANRLDYAGNDGTTKDHHIERRRWLPLDVDPERPTGISASAQEKEAAHKKAQEIYDYLEARGWPGPLVADSGNGYHLVYRIDLPAGDDHLIERLLAGLADRFDGDGVKIDRTVFNPSRIIKLPGTLAAKGDDTEERPHRYSKILRVPEHLEAVTPEQLQGLLQELRALDPKREPAAAARKGSFDMEEFLARYGVEVAGKIFESDRIKWRLKQCPFDPDHETPDAAVFQYPDGKLGFKCFHTSCSDKHWQDFRRHFEPERSRTGKVEFVRPDTGSSRPANREPLELLPPPPPYVPPPLTLLPSLLQDYVIAAAESLKVDVSFILLPMLSSLATAIGHSRSIQLKRGFIQPPVLWTAIIQRSGYLKSPALEAGCLAVNEHEHELMRLNKETQEIYENEYAEWKAEKPAKRGVEPDRAVFLTCSMDDLTIEVLADNLAGNPRGILVMKDEISHWFASFDQYRSKGKGSDVSRWLSLYTAARFSLDRLTDHRHLRIWQPRVSITGGIQPKVLRRVLTEDFFERGLPARFLFAFPKAEQPRWSEATIRPDLRNAVVELSERIWLLVPEPGDHGTTRPTLLGLDADAKAQYIAFYDECGEWAIAADENEEAAWNKLGGYAARLALVGQLARDPDAELVTSDTMRAACELARWFGKEAVRIYAGLSETQEQRQLRELVEFIESRSGTVRVRDLMQSYAPLKNQKDKAEAALNALVKIGRGKWTEVRPVAAGRPTREFHLLRLSTSTQFESFIGETDNSVDVDKPNSQKNEGVGSPAGGAVSGEVDATPAESDKEVETLTGDEKGVGRL